MDYKEAAKNNWSKDPCGAHYVKNKEYLSKEYFEALRKHRYSVETWIPKELKRFDLRNKSVLEIGYGMGSDHYLLAEKGAVMHGIDITPGNKNITEKHLFSGGHVSNLIVGDAEKLPFSNNSFDFVYSMGVIHHIPNMKKVINEIYRVLKPGGQCFIAVYNKNSYNYWLNIIPRYIKNKEYMNMSLSQRLSLIEYPNTNKDIYVRLTTKKELRELFSRYSDVSVVTRGLTKSVLSNTIAENLPDNMIEKLSYVMGWYNVVVAKKINK